MRGKFFKLNNSNTNTNIFIFNPIDDSEEDYKTIKEVLKKLDCKLKIKKHYTKCNNLGEKANLN